MMHVPSLPPTRARTDFHAHHAIQVTLALDGAFDLHLADRTLGGPAMVVGADVRHAFQPTGTIALLFVEPESAAGRTLNSTVLRGKDVARLTGGHEATLRSAIAEAVARNPTDHELRGLGQGLVDQMAGGVAAPPADPRVDASVAWASKHLEDRLSIADVARQVGLSVDRMSHLFVEQTGLPFRTYLLWLRITRAVDAYAQGASLTTAAHDAGFADSAHFSRTFRRMFGIAAAELRLA